MMHRAWCGIEKVPYCFSRSSVKFQGHIALKIVEFDLNWAFPDCNSSLNSPMVMKCCAKLETAKKRCPIVFQGHPSNLKVTRDKTSPILTQIGRFRTIGRSQLSNPSDLPCYNMAISRKSTFIWSQVYLPHCTVKIANQQCCRWTFLENDNRTRLRPGRIYVLGQTDNSEKTAMSYSNSLWPSDAIWWHKSEWTLAQVMACCLIASSHYLNQCWLLTCVAPWHSFKTHFTTIAPTVIFYNELENYILLNYYHISQGPMSYSIWFPLSIVCSVIQAHFINCGSLPSRDSWQTLLPTKSSSNAESTVTGWHQCVMSFQTLSRGSAAYLRSLLLKLI